MAQLFDLKLFGDKKLQRAIDDLDRKIQRKYMRVALRAGAKLIASQFRANTPVFTGRLRRGIKIRAVKPRRGRFGVMIMTPTREKLGLPANTKWYYPAVLEWGGVTKSGRVIPALAFGRRALETTRTAAINLVGATLWRQIASGTKKAA